MAPITEKKRNKNDSRHCDYFALATTSDEVGGDKNLILLQNVVDPIR